MKDIDIVNYVNLRKSSGDTVTQALKDFASEYNISFSCAKRMYYTWKAKIIPVKTNNYMDYNDLVDLCMGLLNLIIHDTENRVREEYDATILSLTRKLKDTKS